METDRNLEMSEELTLFLINLQQDNLEGVKSCFSKACGNSRDFVSLLIYIKRNGLAEDITSDMLDYLCECIEGQNREVSFKPKGSEEEIEISFRDYAIGCLCSLFPDYFASKRDLTNN